MRFRHLLLASTFLALSGLPAAGQDLPRGRVDWLTDFNLAMEEAAVTRKPVLLSFYTTWCGWCRKLEGNTFQAPSFVDFSNHVVTVRVDGDQEKGLAAMYQVTGYPTTILMTRQGRPLVRMNGYKPPDQFMPYMINGLEHRESLEEVAALAESSPEDAEAQYALGDVQFALQQYERARASLNRVIALEDGNSHHLVDDAHLDIALTYLFNYDFESAIPLLEAYLDQHPDSDRRDQGLFFYGFALIREGRVEEGLTRLDEAMEVTSLEYIRFEATRLKKQVEQNGGQG
jgi:thioredoxin-like negative regulator of GroEL